MACGMTDLNDRERVERARRAKLALDEFLGPPIAAIEANYVEKMIAVAATTDPRGPEMQERLGIAIKVVREIRGLIEAHVYDGEIAKAGMIRAERMDTMTDAQKRLLKIGAG